MHAESKKIRHIVKALLSLVAVLFSGCAVRQSETVLPCGKQNHLEAVGLAIYPDPLPEKRRIDEWRARVRSDSARECQTLIAIAENGKRDLVAQEKATVLSLGVNDVPLRPVERYLLNGDEQCFDVVVSIEGSKRVLDSPRKLCARRVDGRWWSMR